MTSEKGSASAPTAASALFEEHAGDAPLKSMTLDVVERSRPPCGSVRPVTCGARRPGTLRTDDVEGAQPKPWPWQRDTYALETVSRPPVRKPRTVEYANNTRDIEDAQAKAGIFFTTLHYPVAARRCGSASPGVHLPDRHTNPLNPRYELPRPTAPPFAEAKEDDTHVKKTRRGDGEYKGAASTTHLVVGGNDVPCDPYDMPRVEELQRPAPPKGLPASNGMGAVPRDYTHDKLKTCDINSRVQPTTLKPKPLGDPAAKRYLDYSDIERSTNHWFIQLKERRAAARIPLALQTKDINSGDFTFVSGRHTSPLTPRYEIHSREVGPFEKKRRTGFHFWLSRRTENTCHTTADIDGAQPGPHEMPDSISHHRQRIENWEEEMRQHPERQTNDAGSLKRTGLRKIPKEDNDVFGPVGEDPQATRYHCPGMTASQATYKPIAQQLEERARAVQVAEAHGQELKAQRCTFAHEMPGGRGTNPVAPLYDYSRSPKKDALFASERQPTLSKAKKQGCRFRMTEEADLYAKPARAGMSAADRVSAAKTLQEEINSVRNLPNLK